MTNIIIYDYYMNVKIHQQINKNKYKLYVKSQRPINDIYNGKIVNPPIFNKILYLLENINIKKLQMLYNMLNFNGRLLIYNKFKNIVDESKLKYKSNKTYIIIKRKDNIQYVFKDMRIVEFIIIGVQKGGTTALAYNISTHPDIYINDNKDPRISEPHFFDINWKNGIDYYKNLFDYSKKIVGEKTPNLLYLKYTYPLIQAVNPFVKIIVCLRNPITRAYSHWKMMKERYNDVLSFEEEVEYELNNKVNENITTYTASKHFIKRGLYYEQIVELFKWFPKHNILILFQEEILLDMVLSYTKIYDFLNLKYHIPTNKLINESIDKTEISSSLCNKLIDFFKEDVIKLEKLLNIKINWFN